MNHAVEIDINEFLEKDEDEDDKKDVAPLVLKVNEPVGESSSDGEVKKKRGRPRKTVYNEGDVRFEDLNIKPTSTKKDVPKKDTKDPPKKSSESPVENKDPVGTPVDEEPTGLPVNTSPIVILGSDGQSENLQKFLSNPRANDKLLATVRSAKATTTVLSAVLEEIAEEAAFIKAWRNDNWNSKEDLSEATARRIKMLRSLVETLVDREKLKDKSLVGKVDFYSDNFQRVLKQFLMTIQTTFRKINIPKQYEDIFFTQLAKDFDGFEKIAEKIYYGKDTKGTDA